MTKHYILFKNKKEIKEIVENPLATISDLKEERKTAL
jgi:hypothetical protein